MLSTSISFDSPEASLTLALEVAEEFGLKSGEAKAVIKEVAAAVTRWRQTARQRGIPEQAISKMASAFEHADLEMARAI
jgi:serine/threonine-protein kinase HipA